MWRGLFVVCVIGCKSKAGCPEGTVAVTGSASFCVDRTEVTVAAYAKCVAGGACTLASEAPAGNGVKDDTIEKLGPLCNANKPDRQQHPINCVTFDQAKAYCAWAHARLPNETEWQLAARGSDNRTYPWGNEPPDATRVNACDPTCEALFEKTFGKPFAPMYPASDGFAATAPVGSFPAGASPFGALDMAGNVGEWVDAMYDADKRTFRGGGWDLTTPGKLEVTHRDAAPPAVESVIIGFRCVR